MAEHYRFFNSAEGDAREYLADEFAEYFRQFLVDGVYPKDGILTLKVTPGSGLAVTIAEGFAFLRGYLYKNDSPLNKTLTAADSNFDRIDRAVIRLDEINRTIKAVVKTGILSTAPEPPGLETSTTVKEISLCQVRVRKAAASIATSDITDERIMVRNTVPNAFGVQTFTGATEPPLMGVGDIWLKEV